MLPDSFASFILTFLGQFNIAVLAALPSTELLLKETESERQWPPSFREFLISLVLTPRKLSENTDLKPFRTICDFYDYITTELVSVLFPKFIEHTSSRLRLEIRQGFLEPYRRLFLAIFFQNITDHRKVQQFMALLSEDCAEDSDEDRNEDSDQDSDELPDIDFRFYVVVAAFQIKSHEPSILDLTKPKLGELFPRIIDHYFVPTDDCSFDPLDGMIPSYMVHSSVWKSQIDIHEDIITAQFGSERDGSCVDIKDLNALDVSEKDGAYKVRFRLKCAANNWGPFDESLFDRSTAKGTEDGNTQALIEFLKLYPRPWFDPKCFQRLLKWACKKQQIELVEAVLKLLGPAAYINSRSEKASAPLCRVFRSPVGRENWEIAGLLMSYRNEHCNFETGDWGWVVTLIRNSIREERYSHAQALLESGFKVPYETWLEMLEEEARDPSRKPWLLQFMIKKCVFKYNDVTYLKYRIYGPNVGPALLATDQNPLLIFSRDKESLYEAGSAKYNHSFLRYFVSHNQLVDQTSEIMLGDE